MAACTASEVRCYATTATNVLQLLLRCRNFHANSVPLASGEKNGSLITWSDTIPTAINSSSNSSNNNNSTYRALIEKNGNLHHNQQQQQHRRRWKAESLSVLNGGGGPLYSSLFQKAQQKQEITLSLYRTTEPCGLYFFLNCIKDNHFHIVSFSKVFQTSFSLPDYSTSFYFFLQRQVTTLLCFGSISFPKFQVTRMIFRVSCCVNPLS